MIKGSFFTTFLPMPFSIFFNCNDDGDDDDMMTTMTYYFIPGAGTQHLSILISSVISQIPCCLFMEDNDQFDICSLQWRKPALVLISGWRNSSISSAGLRAWSPMLSCWWPQCELWRCMEAGQAWVPTVLVKREGKWDCGGAPLRTALAPSETLVWFWHSPEKWQWRTYSFTFETSGYASELVFERWALREPERLYRKPVFASHVARPGLISSSGPSPLNTLWVISEHNWV